ncbi:MAG: hypothetical protein AAGA44_15860 [Pseudomonadota bacterium]
MQALIIVSLLLNVVVLVPVCLGLITDAAWVQASYGQHSAGRSILLSVYLAIGVVSAMLLAFRDPKIVAALLLIQVVYKLTTPFTVGTLQNPVVISNLLIAAVHTVTIVLIWRSFA